MGLLNRLKSAKDSVLSGLVKNFGDFYLNGIGVIDDFKLDSKYKSIELVLKLNGEEDRPCSLTIARYSLSEVEGKQYIHIESALSPDRPWLNTIAKKFISDQMIEIPKNSKAIVKFLL